MKQIINILFCFLVLAACVKKDVDDPQNYIRGRLTVYDESGEEVKTIDLSKIKVKLTDTFTDTTNFLYSKKADSSGYFLFNIPANNRQDKYVVFAEVLDSDGLWYSDTAVVENKKTESKKDKDPGFGTPMLQLKPDVNSQNIFKISVKDSLGGAIGNCPVYFYTSEVVARNSFTLNPVYTYTTDVKGVLRKANMPEGTYYLNAYKDFGNNMILKRKAKRVDVTKNGLQPVDTLGVYRRGT
jgi:hypothetical protein